MKSSLVLVSLLALLFVAIPTVALDNGLGLTPPLGWSSWCSDGDCERDYCDQLEVMAVAEALSKNGMQALGYHWIILDDCWAAGTRNAKTGELQWDTTRFPDGIPKLTAKLHQLGFKFGLYTSAGNQTCSSGGRPYTIPGSEHHYQLDSNTFAAWDIDYVKVDWCGDVHSLSGIFEGAKLYKEFSATLTNTTPSKPLYFEGVAAYLFLHGDVNKYVNSWRASTDHHDNWKNTMGVIDTVNLVGKLGAPGGWSYMDVLMTGGAGCSKGQSNISHPHCPGMTDIEYHTEFAIWSIAQSPLIVSTDVRNMTAVMKEVLLRPRILQAHQNTLTPPGQRTGGYSNCTEYGAMTCQFWTRKMHDGSALMLLFNAGEEEHLMVFDFTAELGWATNTTAIAEDLYQLHPNSTLTGEFVARVPPHGVVYAWLHPQ